MPTIATSVPRAAFTGVTRRLREDLRALGVAVPVVASNRINTPEVAEQVLAAGDADMVSLARPFLADADFVAKAAAGRADEINTCIACNQACLDHAFQNRLASCLVNPRAGHETTLVIRPASARRRFAVVGAGPAGLAAATTLAERGHAVDLFDAAGDDQPHAAARALGIERGHGREVLAPVLQAGVHRPHEHAVGQRGEAEVQRREQVRVGQGRAGVVAGRRESRGPHPPSV